MRIEIGVRLEVWREYCERLNDWDREVDYVPIEGPWEKVSEKEVWEDAQSSCCSMG